MNQLRFAAFMFLFGAPFWLCALGQSSQEPTTLAPASTGVTIKSLPQLNVAPDAVTSQSPDEGVWRRPWVPIEPKTSQAPTRLFSVQGFPKFRLRGNGNRSLNPNVDRGIFLPHPSAENGCASIVSYNFAPGDNPQLESITTCTPSGKVITRRAEAEGSNPASPQIRKIVFPQPQ